MCCSIYVDDIVRLLPLRQRDDVAAELRALLNEELHARGQVSGRLPDEALALSPVRGYGRPNEVAARYQPVWTIIDPADSRSFARVAIIGAGALLVPSALAGPVPALSRIAGDLAILKPFRRPRYNSFPDPYSPIDSSHRNGRGRP